MGDFSFAELLVVVIIAILIYGRDLPQAARKLASLYARLKRQLSDVRDELQSQIPAEEIKADLAAAGAVDADPPAAPVTLAVTPSSEEMRLTWTPSPGAASYTIRRSTGPDEPWYVIASYLTDVSYADVDIAPGKTYRYTVTASNTAGESGESHEAVATLPPAPGTPEPAQGQ